MPVHDEPQPGRHLDRARPRAGPPPGRRVGNAGHEGRVLEHARHPVDGTGRKLGYRASFRTVTDPASGPPTTRPQLGLWGWGAISAAPYAFAAPLVACGTSTNNSHFCDPKLDALMPEAENARGVSSLELWRQVEAGIARNAPIVPLFNPGSVSLAARRVGNWQHNPILGPLLDQMWVR